LPQKPSIRRSSRSNCESDAVERPRRRLTAGAAARLLLGQTISAFEDSVLLINIERLIPEPGEGFLAVPGVGEIPARTPLRPANEVAEVIADMLLHGVVGAEMGGDLRVDLVPTFQIPVQRAEIFVELPFSRPRCGEAGACPHDEADPQAAKGDPGDRCRPRRGRSTITRDMSARMAQLLWRKVTA
jgi:hypothetical protein